MPAAPLVGLSIQPRLPGARKWQKPPFHACPRDPEQVKSICTNESVAIPKGLKTSKKRLYVVSTKEEASSFGADSNTVKRVSVHQLAS